MKTKVSYKIVIVEWVDSIRGAFSWDDIDTERKTPANCVSIGFLVGDHKDVKTICPNIGVEDEWTKETGLGAITIPAKAIISLREIK